MIDIGLILALLASCIALYGVYLFNQRRDYTAANVWWGFGSNPLFVIYFAGRVLHWWNGSLGDIAMLVYFALMTASSWCGWIKKRGSNV